MKTGTSLLSKYSDYTAIGLSMLCAIHCFAFPLLLVLLPSVAALNLESEAFHTWMVMAVIPTSLFALTLGCKKHSRYKLLLLGSSGLCLLTAALFFGEVYEKILTLLGSTIIAVGHYLNYQLCQQHRNACCSNQPTKAYE